MDILIHYELGDYKDFFDTGQNRFLLYSKKMFKALKSEKGI